MVARDGFEFALQLAGAHMHLICHLWQTECWVRVALIQYFLKFFHKSIFFFVQDLAWFALFKELTAESKKEKIDKNTNLRVGFVWHCSPGVDNHAWDLTIYSHAALDVISLAVCEAYIKIDFRDWKLFWEYLEKEKLFFDE